LEHKEIAFIEKSNALSWQTRSLQASFIALHEMRKPAGSNRDIPDPAFLIHNIPATMIYGVFFAGPSKDE